MSLGKIGKLTRSFNSVGKGTGSLKELYNSTAAIGNLNLATKYLVNNNKKNGIDKSNLTNILLGAYKDSDESAVKDAVDKAMKDSATVMGTGFTLKGIGESLKNTGSGLLTFFKPFFPVIIGSMLAGLGYAGFKFLDNQFDLTKATTTKKYQKAQEKNKTAQSDLETAQSEYDSNQERIYELRAKENRSNGESQELNNLQDQNELLGAQVSLKQRLADSTKTAEADAAQKDLNKKSMQQDYFSDGSGNYNPQAKVYVNDLDEAQAKMEYIQHLQDRYDTAYANIKERHNGNMNKITKEENETLEKQQEGIDTQKSELSEMISDISDQSQSMLKDDGTVLDKKYQGTIDQVNSIIDTYSSLMGASSNTDDKINNIFALSDYSDLQDKLEDIGKSKGSKGLKKALEDDNTYSDLLSALEDKNVSTEDLTDYIMSIADPDAKNIEGIKQNLKDEFSYNKKLNKFFKDKSDKDIEGFWDYYQSQGFDAEEYNWKKKDLSDNWDDYLETKEKTKEEGTPFSSLFKNATEDTASDIDTVTDNFQTDIGNIKSAMDKLRTGEMKNSDITDLIQQFPELADETDDLQQGLQKVATDKASTAIGKIRDAVKDTTDPKELAAADKYVQSILDSNRQIWRDFYEFVITSSNEDFVAHLGDWVIEDAFLYMYLFTLRYTMIDNRAKNIFPHWAKHYMTTAEAAEAGDKAQYYIIDDAKAAINNGYRFDLWDYDNDSSLGINNSGELTMSYGKEDTDYKEDGKPSSGYIFNAAESTIWCRIRDLMKTQLRRMYQSLPQNCFSAEHLINEFDAWQNQFPEELWRLHYDRLYFRTYRGVMLPGKTEITKTDRFVKEMMNGRKKYQRRQWERDQHFYMGSKFVHTDITSDQIMFRCNTPKDAIVKPDYTLKIVPYSDMYVSVLYGNSSDITQVRAKAGQEYELKTNLTNMDDTAILIYGASRIQALNDLSACYIHDNDFSKASKLKTLIIGNNTEGYQNTFLTNLNMGNNTLLDTLDVRNCPNLTGTINLSACENLISLYADGTIVTSVSFANHGKITYVHLPETINNLTFQNLKNLTDFNIPSYKNLEKFICESSTFDALSVVKAAIDSLKSARITDIDWNLEDTTLLKKLAKIQGEDESGSTTAHAVLTGKVHVPVIRAQELKALKALVDGKAAASHGHSISQISNLQATLDGKAASSHTHTIASVTGLQDALNGKAASSHTHAIANITGLQDALNGKASSGHTHSTFSGEIHFSVGNYTDPADGISTAIKASGGIASDVFYEGTIKLSDKYQPKGSYAAASHTHTIAQITNLQSTLNGKANSSHTHNYAGSSSSGGAANSAVKLSTARNFSISGGATAAAVSFDGSGNVALSVTSLNTDYLNNGSNTLILACGGAA